MKTFILIFFTLLMFCPLLSSSQDLDSLLYEELLQEEEIDSLIDVVLTDDDTFEDLVGKKKNKYSILYTSLDYMSNTYIAGRDLGVDQFNLSGSVSYYHSSGLSLGISGIWYSEFAPKYNTTILTAGYSGKIKKWQGFKYNLSYDRYFFAEVEEDSIPNIPFRNSFNTGVSYKWKFLGTRLDASFLTGEEFSTQLSWDLYADIPIVKFGRYNEFAFEPRLSLFFGNETIVSSQIENLSLRTIIQNRRRGIPSFSEEDIFGLMNTQLVLPLYLAMGNLDFEVAYNFNFPRVLGENNIQQDFDNTSFLSVSLGYMIDLTKN